MDLMLNYYLIGKLGFVLHEQMARIVIQII